MTWLLVLLVVAGIYGVSAYNRFVKLKNESEEAWSGIDVQLKRRYDLIPNLIETVKGYAKHEKETFENIVSLRNAAQSASDGSVEAKAKAENALGLGLGKLFALAEGYPELKANTNFLDLQNSLEEVEDGIQKARRYYNAVVRDNNTYCESFPSVIVANIFNFSKRDFFEMDEREKGNVEVKF